MTAALTEFASCLCGQPIRAHGRGWVHLDGYYRCRSGVEGTGWAEPFDNASLERAKQEAYEDGWQEADRHADDEKEDAYDEGYAEGFHHGDAAGYHRCREAMLQIAQSRCPEHIDEFERLS